MENTNIYYPHILYRAIKKIVLLLFYAYQGIIQ